jgi:hypothetical protein
MTEDKSYCHTCSRTRHDADVIACKQTFCDARSVLGRCTRQSGTRPPQPNPGEAKPDLYDSWAGMGLVYKLEIDASGNVVYRVEPSA